jgi:hypothetical protein
MVYDDLVMHINPNQGLYKVELLRREACISSAHLDRVNACMPMLVWVPALKETRFISVFTDELVLHSCICIEVCICDFLTSGTLRFR